MSVSRGHPLLLLHKLNCQNLILTAYSPEDQCCMLKCSNWGGYGWPYEVSWNPSPVTWHTTGLCGQCYSGIVLGCYRKTCDIMKRAPHNIHRTKFCFHGCRHSCGKTCEFFPNIFLKCCSLPPTYFLNLHVWVATKSKRICSSTAKWMRVNPVDWYFFKWWVIKGSCHHFESLWYLVGHDIVFGALFEVSW